MSGSTAGAFMELLIQCSLWCLHCRDVLFLGDTDDGVQHLARLLGWEQELEELMNNATAPTAKDASSSQQRSL